MKKDTTSSESQVTEESTIKPVAVDLADHVNLNDFIFDGMKQKDIHFSSIAAAVRTKLNVTAPF